MTHEILAVLLTLVLVASAIVAVVYIWILGRFFEELKAREPEVWARVGSPGLLDMVALPFLRFRKYSAFLPVLRERADRRDSRYNYAAAAYLLLKAGLGMTLVLFTLAGLILFRIAG